MSHDDVPEGSIIITPAQVYEKVTGLTEKVTRLLLQNEQANRDRTDDRAAIAKLEERVGDELRLVKARVDALERRVWLITGAAAAVGGSIGSWLPAVLTG